MKRKFFGLLLIMAMGIAGRKVSAGQEIGLSPVIFDLQRLEETKKESFADFMTDIKERDIFSSPQFETSQQPLPEEEITITPELKLIYRGKLEADGNKTAMIEAVKDEVKRNYFVKEGELVEGFRIVDIKREFVVIYNQQKGERKLFFSGQRRN